MLWPHRYGTGIVLHRKILRTNGIKAPPRTSSCKPRYCRSFYDDGVITVSLRLETPKLDRVVGFPLQAETFTAALSTGLNWNGSAMGDGRSLPCFVTAKLRHDPLTFLPNRRRPPGPPQPTTPSIIVKMMLPAPLLLAVCAFAGSFFSLRLIGLTFHLLVRRIHHDPPLMRWWFLFRVIVSQCYCADDYR